MLRRALLAVAVLSYLICVLVLSGGQRDDVINNVNLYKNCQNNSNVDISNSINNSSSFKNVVQQLHDVSNDNSSRKIIDKNKNNQTQATEPEKVIIARDKRTAVTSKNFDNHTTFYHQANANENVKYLENKPDFHNVISFWQRFGKSVQQTPTDNPNQNEQNKILSNFLNNTNNAYFSKLIINKNSLHKDIIEGEYLGSILPPFLSKEIVNQTSTTTTSTVDLVTDDDTDLFKYILDSPDNESVEKHDINAHVNQYSYEINYSKIVYKNNNKSKHTEQSSEIVKPYRINGYENVKTDNAQHNIHFHEEKDVGNKKAKIKHEHTSKHKKEKLISMKDDALYKSDNSHSNPVHDELDVKYSIERTHYVYTTVKPEVKYDKLYHEHTTSTLPPEVIKKIAEDVKAMILKDFKRKTTTKLPVTIKKGLDALIPKYNAGQNVVPSYNPEQNLIPRQNMVKPYPLNRILDILQKYRNGDDLSVYRKPNEVVPVTVYTTPKPPQKEYAYYLPIENKPLKYENNSPYVNPYSYKALQSKKISPRIKFQVQKQKNFIPQRELPVKSYPSSNLKSTPITLQTNLIEIPPIGVPMSDTLTFINHVMITTRRPFRYKQRNYPQNTNIKSKNTNPIKRKPVRTRNVNPRVNKNIGYDYYKNNKQNDVNKKSITDFDESREIKATQPRAVYRPRSQSNIKKFHEKLEQYPNTKYKAMSIDCCKDEIFTSEQLAGEEMRSRDEVSFRNLLKTQQKVTDMLTKMLAKRKKEDIPLSVEAA